MTRTLVATCAILATTLAAQASALADDAIEVTIATVAPAKTPWAELLTKYKTNVEAKSGGRLKIKVKLNGTLGESAFDTHGTERRRFEKAVVTRVSARTDLGWARGQIGSSFYFSQNNNQANPLFGRSIPSADAGLVGIGVDEVRAGGFATANLGRFTYLADLAWVRDTFYSDRLTPRRGYASYQELSFLPVQGLDLVATFEFADPDMDVLDNRAMRAGFAAELFPWPFTELRAMVRRSWDQASPTGGAWDVVVFSHLFL